MENSDSEKPSNTLTEELSRTVLELEEIDRTLYRGTNLWKPHGARGVFGGQVIGQTLVAAGKTIKENWHVHSMHGYFLQKGNEQKPILYQVDCVRDGKSFSARTVKAIQNGVVIFNGMVSYHVGETIPVESQPTMPVVAPPEELDNLENLLKKALENPSISEMMTERLTARLKAMLAQEVMLELRPIHPDDYFKPRDMQMFWVKTRSPLGNVHNNLHRCVAAYGSDLMLLGTTLLQTPEFRPKMMASLDHSMWFHCPFRADEWMLYEIHSQRLLYGRGLAYGRLWTRDGRLAVSVAQEGVVRGKVVNSQL